MRKFEGLFESAMDFRKSVVPPDAPKIQVTEMDKAFKAGWIAAFYTVCDVCDLEEDAAVQELERMMKEIEMHRDNLKEEARSST